VLFITSVKHLQAKGNIAFAFYFTRDAQYRKLGSPERVVIAVKNEIGCENLFYQLGFVRDLLMVLQRAFIIFCLSINAGVVPQILADQFEVPTVVFL
jgi:hypothetical protein